MDSTTIYKKCLISQQALFLANCYSVFDFSRFEKLIWGQFVQNKVLLTIWQTLQSAVFRARFHLFFSWVFAFSVLREVEITSFTPLFPNDWIKFLHQLITKFVCRLSSTFRIKRHFLLLLKNHLKYKVEINNISIAC